MPRPIKVGTREYHVAVHKLEGGEFTYTIVEVDMTAPAASRVRYESRHRFRTETEAYDGGSFDARRRARGKVPRFE